MPSEDILRHVATDVLFDAAPDAWIIAGTDGRIVAANALAPKLFGHPELVGLAVEELLPDRLRERHERLRGGYVEDPEPRAMASGLELHGKRADGSVFPVQVSLSPIAVGDATYVIAAVRDDSDAVATRLELATAREQTVVAEDRDRLARDLHDTVIQELFAVGLGLQSVGATSESHQTQLRLQQAIDDLDRVIRDIRGVIFDLGVRPGARSDVVAEIERILASERAALHFTPQLRVDGDPRGVSADIAGHLRHVVREGLSNVARHARATEADVLLSIDGENVSLEIVDNGQGPSETGPSPGGGRGLGNLGARARLLGGECEFGAAASGGSRLRWTVPQETGDEA
ncbi:MAG: PAS domain S-box protein [Actinomycetota bacterium]